MVKLYRVRIIKRDRKYINSLISECKIRNSSTFEMYNISIANKNRMVLYLNNIHCPRVVRYRRLESISYISYPKLDRYDIVLLLNTGIYIPILSLPTDSEIIKKEGIYRVISLLETALIFRDINYHVIIGFEIKKIYK